MDKTLSCTMSSSSKRSSAAAAAVADQLTTETDMQTLVKEKDDEIKSLKEEIKSYKTTIAWQQKELQRLGSSKRKDGDITAASVEGIAQESLKNVGPSKVDSRWKTRFQQVVAYKLQVRISRRDCCRCRSLASAYFTLIQNHHSFSLHSTATAMSQSRIVTSLSTRGSEHSERARKPLMPKSPARA